MVELSEDSIQETRGGKKKLETVQVHFGKQKVNSNACIMKYQSL